MLTLATVTRNARYWHDWGTLLCPDNSCAQITKGKSKFKIKDKGHWNGPLLRLEGDSACPPESAAYVQNRVHTSS